MSLLVCTPSARLNTLRFIMIGIIGGTGLYQFEALTDVQSIAIQTPYGPPSSQISVGRLGNQQVAFLPRHGAGPALLPGEINFRANIYALKKAGAKRIMGVSAVGSLKLEYEPGDLAIPSQYLDFTRGARPFTFFGQGLVAHISTAEPTCKALAGAVSEQAHKLGLRAHTQATYACVEGPRLGNRAESRMMQKLGADLVGMTNVPEVYLAREAGLCYCTIGIVTDYDCWLEDPSQHASVELVFRRYKESLSKARQVLESVIRAAPVRDCSCSQALTGAVMTPEHALAPDKKELLEFLKS